MRPLDVYTEKQVRDTRTDQQAYRSLYQESMKLAMLGAGTGALSSRDIRQLEKELVREEGSDRDKMAFASLAFCSPLMLLGMGATFAFMDDMKMSRVSRIENSLRNRVQFQRHQLNAEADASARAHTKKLSTAMEPLPLAKPTEKKPGNRLGDKKHDSVEKKRTMLSAVGGDGAVMRSERNIKKPIKDFKDSGRAKKMRKEKQELVDYMENMRGKLSLKSASNLLARIEQLDKALKREEM